MSRQAMQAMDSRSGSQTDHGVIQIATICGHSWSTTVLKKCIVSLNAYRPSRPGMLPEVSEWEYEIRTVRPLQLAIAARLTAAKCVSSVHERRTATKGRDSLRGCRIPSCFRGSKSSIGVGGRAYFRLTLAMSFILYLMRH